MSALSNRADAYLSTPRLSGASLAVVVALHGAVLFALFSMQVVRIPPELSTLMVRVIQPEPPPKVQPPKPKPPSKQPVPPQPRPQQPEEPPPLPQIVAAASPAPSSAGVAPPPREIPPPAPPAPPPPAPLVEPRFDADYLDNPAPVYPAMSRRMEETGKTVLRVYVEPSGKPSQVQIKSSSGSPRLDQAAQDAVWRWKFVPARRGAEAVAAWVLVPIVFNL